MSVCSWVTLSGGHLLEGTCGGYSRTSTDNLRCGREYWERISGPVSLMLEVGTRGKEMNCEDGACWRPPVAKWPAAAPFLFAIHCATRIEDTSGTLDEKGKSS